MNWPLQGASVIRKHTNIHFIPSLCNNITGSDQVYVCEVLTHPVLELPAPAQLKSRVFQNEYNEECREKVGSLLRELGHRDALQWLLRETEPIG